MCGDFTFISFDIYDDDKKVLELKIPQGIT